MEDTIEICSGCGKMPRSLDHAAGSFVCSRCGNRSTTHVSSDNYEKVVVELDRNFHEKILRVKYQIAAAEPIRAKKSKAAPKKAAKKAVKKVAKKAGKKKRK